MTRSNITMNESIKLVLFALTNGGKEVKFFVPKIPSWYDLDVAKAINVNCKTKVVGIRAGEKFMRK